MRASKNKNKILRNLERINQKMIKWLTIGDRSRVEG
jgi:hypothetical protein